MCIASETIGPVGSLSFHPGRGPRSVPYWLAMAPNAVPGVPPLVAVHGIRRGAQQQASLFAKRAAAMGRHVIAPLFDKETWAGYQQAFLRGRADLALLDVLADLRLQGVITSEHVDLFGFSGGAQFVHRFAMLHPQVVGTLSIASPGWYTFFDEAPYPYGLSPRAGRSDSWAPSLIANLDRFLALPMRVCIGEKDRFPDKNTRRGFEIDAQQGLHRMARAERWTEAVRSAARAMGVKPDIALHVLPGCGHDFAACMTRGEMDRIVIDTRTVQPVPGPCQGLCKAAQRRACQGASPDVARASGGGAMSKLPKINGEGRGRNIGVLIALALGQASAAGLAAFATRDVFAAFRDQSTALPLLALGLVASAGIAVAICRFFERVVAEQVGQDYAASLRIRLFKHMSRVSVRDIGARRNGSLALRFVGDLTAVRGWVSMGLARLISALIVLPVATAVLFYMNADIGMAVAVPVGLGLLVSAALGPRLGPVHKRLRARRARLAADMSERIPHAPELRLLGRIQIETRRLKTKTDALIDAALERAKGAALLRAIPDAVSGLAAASVFWVALTQGLPAAQAAGALAAVGLMIQPMRDLAGVWDRHRAWRNARQKCKNLLDMPKLDTARSEGADVPDAPPALVFTDAASGALSDITVQARPGQKIGIIGANGAGKSTLLSLAAGLEHPRAGQVMLGGVPATGLTTRERRELVAWVGSRSPILKGSLRRALIMGAQPRPDDNSIISQAERFGLGRVIDRLGGLDGQVAEAGRNLSAGEIRRVLLTRAALSRPRVLLLDEPDDALDSEGPALVRALVHQCDATALLITHNMQIAMAMDELWVVENGRVVRTGTPDVVLADVQAGR